MKATTIREIAAILAAQKINHTLVDDSQPIIFVPLPGQDPVTSGPQALIYHNASIGRAEIVHSTLIPNTAPIIDEDSLKEALAMLTPKARQKPSEAVLEALVREPRILAAAFAE